MIEPGSDTERANSDLYGYHCPLFSVSFIRVKLFLNLAVDTLCDADAPGFN